MERNLGQGCVWWREERRLGKRRPDKQLLPPWLQPKHLGLQVQISKDKEVVGKKSSFYERRKYAFHIVGFFLNLPNLADEATHRSFLGEEFDTSCWI